MSAAMPPSSSNAAPAHGDAHAIVLAAGGGRRFGGDKMLADWQGAPLVCAAVRIALSAPVARVTVVTGAGGDAVKAALAGLAGPRLAFARNPDWARGLASSLRCGLDALPAGVERVVVFLGDMPEVAPAVAGDVLAALAQGASAVLPDLDGAPAHPVAFTRRLFAAVRTAEGDQGARAILAAAPGAVRLAVEAPGCRFDVDRPEDLVRR